ncbi:MAG: tetratricopeptide repeat protein [Gallionellaceae bacterium]|nr:tetratricopeptide repeat protein [Gallionellaceae bacterium]
MERSAGLNSLRGNVATQSIAFAYLLRQWIFPLWPNIDPDLKVVHGFTGQMPQLFFLAVVLVLMPVTFRRRPWIGFALAWAFIQLVPLYVFLPRLDVANDRQMYLVSWPLALAFTAEMAIWMNQKTFALAGAALALVSGSLTVMRNHVYQNEISLWENTVIQSPDKARVHNNLGYAYKLDGRKDEARKEFEIALKMDPDYYKARNNLLGLDGP